MELAFKEVAYMKNSGIASQSGQVTLHIDPAEPPVAQPQKRIHTETNWMCFYRNWKTQRLLKMWRDPPIGSLTL